MCLVLYLFKVFEGSYQLISNDLYGNGIQKLQIL